MSKGTFPKLLESTSIYFENYNTRPLSFGLLQILRRKCGGIRSSQDMIKKMRFRGKDSSLYNR